MKTMYILFILFFVSCGFTQKLDFENYAKYQDIFHEAIKYGKMGEYEISKIMFYKYITFYPGYLEAQIYYEIICDAIDNKWKKGALESFFEAVKYNYRANNEKALLGLSVTINENPDYANFYLIRGIVFENLRFEVEALQDYTRSIELSPSSYYGYYYRGLIFRRRDEYHKALSDLRKVKEINPSFTGAYIEEAHILNQQKKYDESVQIFRSIAKLDTFIKVSLSYYEAFYNHGIQCFKLKNYEDAVSDFTEAIESFPKREATYVSRSKAYRYLELYDSALFDCNKAIEINPESADAYLNRGIIYSEQSNYSEASRDFISAASHNNDDCRPWYYLGELYFKQEEYEMAIINYDRAITYNSKYFWAHYKKGMSCDLIGRKQQAINSYSEFIRISPDQYFKQISYARQRIKELKKQR